MEELENKIDSLINALEKNENVEEIKKLNNVIKEDKELMKLLEEFQKTQDEKIKNKIILNKNFQKYKEYETEINLLILHINKKLKEITDRNGCIQ